MRIVRFLPEIVALVLLAWAISGCVTRDQWIAAASSTRVGMSDFDGDWSMNKQGQRHGSTNGRSVFADLAPLRWWEMRLQAEMQARTLVEAAYARRNCHDCDEECEGCD